MFAIKRTISKFAAHVLVNDGWWWIAFVVWLTDQKRLALFPAGTIVRDPHYRESPTHREQGLNLAEPEFRLSGMKLWSSDKHYTTAPWNWNGRIWWTPHQSDYDFFYWNY